MGKFVLPFDSAGRLFCSSDAFARNDLRPVRIQTPEQQELPQADGPWFLNSLHSGLIPAFPVPVFLFQIVWNYCPRPIGIVDWEAGKGHGYRIQPRMFEKSSPEFEICGELQA